MMPPFVRRHAHHLAFALLSLFLSDLWRANTTLLPDAFLTYLNLPWACHGDFTPERTNPLRSDIPWMFEAKREEARRQISSGEWPLWDAKSEFGQPLMAGQQCALFSPFTWPQLWLGVRAGFDLSLALECLVLLYGTRRLLLRLGCFDPWATWGALVIACTGMCTVWRGYPVTGALAWMPWLWLTTLHLAHGGKRALVAAIFVRTCLLYSGHPETAFKLLIVDALIALCYPVGWPAKRRTVARVALVGGIAFAFSGPQSLPTLEYLAHSQALAVREAIPEPDRLPHATLVTLWLPHFFGSPIVEGEIMPNWAGPMNYSEIQAFVSLGVLLAVLISLRPSRFDRDTRLLVGLAGMAVCIAYPCGPLTWAFNQVPPLRICLPSRWMFILQAMLVLQAARSLSAEARAGQHRTAYVLALLSLAQALPFTQSFHPPSAIRDLPAITPELALLQREAAREPGGRILPLGVLDPGAHLFYGLSSLRSYDAIGVRRSGEALNNLGFADHSPRLISRVEPSLLAAADVRWVLSAEAWPWAVPIAGSATPVPVAHSFDVPRAGASPLRVGFFIDQRPDHALWLDDSRGNRARLPLEPGCTLELAGTQFTVEGAGPPQFLAGMKPVEHRARILRIEQAPDLSSPSDAGLIRASTDEPLYLAALSTHRHEYQRLDDQLPCAVYSVAQPIGSAFALPASTNLPSDLMALAAEITAQRVESLAVESERAMSISVVRSAAETQWIAFSRVIYPGWEMRLDGVSMPFASIAGIYPALEVPAGVHRVEWIYRPLSFTLGLILAGVAALGTILMLCIPTPRSIEMPS